MSSKQNASEPSSDAVDPLSSVPTGIGTITVVESVEPYLPLFPLSLIFKFPTGIMEYAQLNVSSFDLDTKEILLFMNVPFVGSGSEIAARF